MNIISLQSAVAFGHVGNSAAVFPLQRMGFDVWPVDTVQFSNHPGHGQWRGTVMHPDHVREVVHGLDEIGALADCDAVLAGYLGDADSGEAVSLAVERVKAHRPDALFLCDPVMGDVRTGLYVRPGIPEILSARLVPAADIVTPNAFELHVLTALPTGTEAECIQAAQALLARGPKTVIVTGLEGEDTVTSLAVTAKGAWAIRTPLLVFDPPVNGAGDLLAALVLGHMLQGAAAETALSRAVSSVFGVLQASIGSGSRDLALVRAQDEIVAPSRVFGRNLLPEG